MLLALGIAVTIVAVWLPLAVYGPEIARRLFRKA